MNRAVVDLDRKPEIHPSGRADRGVRGEEVVLQIETTSAVRFTSRTNAVSYQSRLNG